MFRSIFLNHCFWITCIVLTCVAVFVYCVNYLQCLSHRMTSQSCFHAWRLQQVIDTIYITSSSYSPFASRSVVVCSKFVIFHINCWMFVRWSKILLDDTFCERESDVIVRFRLLYAVSADSVNCCNHFICLLYAVNNLSFECNVKIKLM